MTTTARRPTQSPDLGAAQVGSTVADLAAQLPEGDDYRENLRAFLADTGRVDSVLRTAATNPQAQGGDDPTGALRRSQQSHVLERVLGQTRNQRQGAASQARHEASLVCPVLGTFDASTSHRILFGKEFKVSDLGEVALQAAAAELLGADAMDRARALVAGLAPPDEPTAEPKRRGLRR